MPSVRIVLHMKACKNMLIAPNMISYLMCPIYLLTQLYTHEFCKTAYIQIKYT